MALAIIAPAHADPAHDAKRHTTHHPAPHHAARHQAPHRRARHPAPTHRVVHRRVDVHSNVHADFHHGGYRHDHHHAYHHATEWRRGGRYYGPRVVYRDWGRYHLRRPPPGYEWVREGNRLVLIAAATGIIADLFSLPGY
jgi:Ni/Co efflux regulator RcnB